jgi:hypothetical protein
MDLPLRSFATDAQDCIMVRVSRPTAYKVAVRLISRCERRAPLKSSSRPADSAIVLGAVKDKPSRARDSRASLTAPARDACQELWVGAKKRASRSNQETGTKKDDGALRSVLDFRSPIQGTRGTPHGRFVVSACYGDLSGAADRPGSV